MSEAVFLAVIAGGSGTRFWPKSTSKRPKQLLSFGKEKDARSLLSQTVLRFRGIVPEDESHRLIITTRLLEKSVEQDVPGVRILAEPQGRNTAPCVYWGAREIAKINPEAVMMVMPADHYIAYPEKFKDTVRAAIQWARQHDDLVTLGVRPTRPETGYGYLRVGRSLMQGCHQVEAFVEKPNAERAREFLASGRYLWNGGMFIWRASVILKAFDDAMPEMKRVWDETEGRVEETYPRLTATSIDYGVMEKAKNVVSFPLDCGWDDLGSWTSLEGVADVLHARQEGNVITGGDLVAIDSRGNIVDAPQRIVSLLGVNDLVVVEAGQSILVAHKSRAQDIRLIVDFLKKNKPDLV